MREMMRKAVNRWGQSGAIISTPEETNKPGDWGYPTHGLPIFTSWELLAKLSARPRAVGAKEERLERHQGWETRAASATPSMLTAAISRYSAQNLSTERCVDRDQAKLSYASVDLGQTSR